MSASASATHASWDPTHTVTEPGNQAVLETEGIPGEGTVFTSGTNGGKATDTEKTRIKSKRKKGRTSKTSQNKRNKARSAKEKAQRKELRPIRKTFKNIFKWGSRKNESARAC